MPLQPVVRSQRSQRSQTVTFMNDLTGQCGLHDEVLRTRFHVFVALRLDTTQVQAPAGLRQVFADRLEEMGLPQPRSTINVERIVVRGARLGDHSEVEECVSIVAPKGMS